MCLFFRWSVFLVILAFVSGCSHLPNPRNSLRDGADFPVHLYIEKADFKYQVPLNPNVGLNPIPILTLLTATVQMQVNNLTANDHMRLNAAAKEQGIETNHSKNFISKLAAMLRMSGREVYIHEIPFVDNRIIDSTPNRFKLIPRPAEPIPVRSASMAIRNEFGSCTFKRITPCARVTLYSMQAQEQQPPIVSEIPWRTLVIPEIVPQNDAFKVYASIEDAVADIGGFDKTLDGLVTSVVQNVFSILMNSPEGGNK